MLETLALIIASAVLVAAASEEVLDVLPASLRARAAAAVTAIKH